MSHVLATVVVKPFTTRYGPTLSGRSTARWAPTTLSPGARTTGAAARSTPPAAPPRWHDAASSPTSPGRWNGRPGADSVYSDCGATVLANFEQTKISAPPNLNEPIGFDQFPDGRSSRPPAAARSGCTTRRSARAGHRDDPRLHQQRGRAVRPRGRQRLRNEPLGLPVLRAADRHRGAVGRRHPHASPRRPASAPTTAADPGAWDPWLGYFQLSRFKFVDGAARPARPRLGAEDPPGAEQPGRLLPRRR